MKVKKLLLAGSLAACMAVSGYAQTVINFTGATAFRAASHNAIRTIFEQNGGVEYAYSGNQDLAGANRAIFSGTIGGEEYIIRTSWSGSGAGVRALAFNEDVQVLALTTERDAGGVQISNPVFEMAPASFAFSDVEQTATNTPDAGLTGTPVGVVPFMFVASRAAPESFTTMTDQLMENLYTNGNAPLSMFSGDPEDSAVIVLPTGRNNSSGTRITILAETGFGIKNEVNHVQVNGALGEPITFAHLATFAGGANDGYTSNSFIRDVVQRDSEGLVIVSYLTISDALVATAPIDGVSGGARALEYNGVEYSEENVKNGKYTLWGYQQLYQKNGLSAGETTFLELLKQTIPNTLGSAGIPIPEMKVDRIGGDGGLVVPIGGF